MFMRSSCCDLKRVVYLQHRCKLVRHDERVGVGSARRQSNDRFLALERIRTSNFAEVRRPVNLVLCAVSRSRVAEKYPLEAFRD